MSKKPVPMTTEEIENTVQEWLSDATTYMEAELSPGRAEATKRYQGQPFGNEEKGRSQFVCTDTRDTVLAVMPSLIRLFLPTSGHVIEYQPRPKSLGDVTQAVALAEQATEFVNSIVLDQDNDGFLEIHAAFKDGLVRKTGWLKWWWDDKSTYQDYEGRGLDVLQYEQLLQDPDVEITKESLRQESGLPPYHDVEYRYWRREGIAKFLCVPPEEVLFSREGRSRNDALFFAHRTEKTKSELMAMGVPEEEIDQFGGASTDIRQSIEETTRRGGISHLDRVTDPALQKHLWIEAYPYLPLDGSDAVLCRVNCLGPSCHLIGDPEPLEERPFALFCPDPEPHVIVGQSLADRTMDIEKMKSSVVRAAADGLSATIFPRRYYTKGAVDEQAMRSTAMGQDVGIEDGLLPSQVVQTEQIEWKGQDALALVGYLDSVLQSRRGPLPATLDPDSLQSTPEVGVKATVQAASEQLELIARVFAATGMKQLGRGLLRLLVEHQPRARLVRLRGQYVEVDPKAWDAEMDVSVHVALGTQEKLGVLAATAADQFQILSTLGPSNPVCGVGQYVHTRKTMLQLRGIQDTGKFYNDLPVNWQPPPQPQQPDPNALIAQAEMAKAQAQIATQQAKVEQDRIKLMHDEAKLHGDVEQTIAELALKREEMHLVDERERDKNEADIALRAAELNAQYQLAIETKGMEVDIKREQMAHDAQMSRETLKANGDKPKKKNVTVNRSDGRTLKMEISEGDPT